MAKRLAELGALQDAVSNDESSPKRLALAGYIRGLFLDWSANPYNPLSRLTARGRLLGYFWDSGAIGLSMNFADQNYLVKDGTVQSKSFSQIVNFSRTTNATVTNSAGQITYAPHNLLTFSEQFDNAYWTKNNFGTFFAGTITANSTVAPDQTTTADLFTVYAPSAGSNGIAQRVTANPSTTYTYSIYIKNNNYLSTNNGLAIWANTYNSGTLVRPEVSLTYIQSQISTSNWVRVSLSVTMAASGENQVAFFVGSAFDHRNESFYLWGAQVEIGSTATTYNSTTVKNQLGFSELFDNAAWTKSNSFVQTNLLTYSEDFTVAGWAKTTVTATANSFIAPNGYQTADTLLATNANSTALQTFTASAVPYTFSIYLYRKTGTGNIDITVDGTTWVTKTITAGWTRVDTTLTPAAGSKTAGIRIATNGDEVYAWGAQLVQGSVTGDYRRTDATALPVYYPNHNGVVCAEKLVENTAASAVHEISQTAARISGTPQTVSVYAKAAEKSKFSILSNSASNPRATFDLSAVTATPEAGSTATITAVGNGWYRCSATATAGSSTSPTISISLTNSSGSATYTGDGTSGIYIFGAQLSDSASLDPYVLNAAAAPTAAAYYGARFDYDPVTLAPKGLLIEEQRSNLITYSDDFRNTTDAGATRPWTYNAITLSANNTISPDGTQNADKLIETATTSYHGVYQSVTTSGILTFSTYFKAAERTYGIMFFDSVGAGNCIFNLSTGTYSLTVGTGTRIVSASMASVGNGWYRCSITSPTLASAAYFPVVGASDGTASYLGDITKGVYVWGAQLEAGAFATSYIPTAASQVTRAADVATIQGSNFYSWYNQNEGTLFANFLTEYSGNADTARYIMSLDNSTSKRVLYVGSGGETLSNFDGSSIITANTDVTNVQTKAATSYTPSNRYITANNIAVTSGNVVGTYSYSSSLNISSPVALCGWVKQISYYPQRLSNDVLKGLTA